MCPVVDSVNHSSLVQVGRQAACTRGLAGGREGCGACDVSLRMRSAATAPQSGISSQGPLFSLLSFSPHSLSSHSPSQSDISYVYFKDLFELTTKAAYAAGQQARAGCRGRANQPLQQASPQAGRHAGRPAS